MDPGGIAADLYGRVYVSEYNNSHISVFTSEGEIMTSFGKGQLSRPRGLAVDSSGIVYVCDQDKGVLLF